VNQKGAASGRAFGAAVEAPQDDRWRNVPAALRERQAWVCWRPEMRDGRPTKVPYIAEDDCLQRARSNDAFTWRSFEEAVRHAPKPGGIGIMLGDGLAGADLDDCMNGDGTPKPWADTIIAQLDSYSEVSPSGEGVKVFFFGQIPPGGSRKRMDDGELELYCKKRFFTITGQRLAGTPETVQQRQVEIEALHARLFGGNGDIPARTPAQAPAQPFAVSDQQLLQVAFAAKNGDKIRRLFDEPGAPQNSEGDASLCALLAFYSGGDPARLEGFMRASNRVRDKWDERRGQETWIARECRQAIEQCGEFYTPPRKRREGRVGRGGPEGEPQVARLMRLAAAVDLFRDADGGLWATAPVADHRETFPLAERGGGIRHWLTNRFHEAEGRPPSSTALGEAVNACVSQATERPVRQVALRVAEAAGALWLDLADERRRAARVTADGWQTTSYLPGDLRFYRPSGMRALPTPERPGNLEALRDFVNTDAEGFVLVTAWLLTCLRPGYPYPILALAGEQGTGKSTLSRLLRLLVDPCGAEGTGLSRPPKDDKDLFAIVTMNHVVAFDNLSSLSADLSDSLSALATGAGLQKRRLYTDADLHATYARRPVCLNAIGQVATRGDLLDRALVVTLNPLSDDERRREDVFWREARNAAPAILGGLLTAASTALRNLPRLQPPALPRMADFATWIMAAEPALPWRPGEFLAAYSGNRQDAVLSTLEADAFSRQLYLLGQEGFEGTASALLAALETHVAEAELRKRGWPGNARVASQAVTRLAPALRAAGVEVSRRKVRGEFLIALTPRG